MIFTSEGSVLRGEYRQRFSNGRIDLRGTAGYVDQYDDSSVETGDRGIEGNAGMEGMSARTQTWRGGIDFEQPSDRTYLRGFRLRHAREERRVGQVYVGPGRLPWRCEQ